MEEDDELLGTAKRQAEGLLYLATLLQGKQSGREKTWKHLVNVLSWEPGKTTTKRQEERDELLRMEQEMFGTLNRWWGDAHPGAPSNGHAPAEVTSDGG